MKNISKNTQFFLEYGFKGNGKYYTYSQGYKALNNSSFTNFIRSNSDCVNIIGSGNDAPRGGKIGDYIIVEFNEKFYAKWQWFFDHVEKLAQDVLIKDAAIKSKIAELGDQEEKLNLYFVERPGKAAEWAEKINQMPAAKKRNWLRMKTASKVADSSFELLTLTAPEIMQILKNNI
jgi:hypothetical protein